MSLFGTPAASTGTGLFGQQAQNQQQSTSLFGASQPAASTSLFGNKPAAAPTVTTSLFGQTPAGTQQQTSLFGNSTNQQAQPQQQGGLFGQPAQQQSGGLFGQPAKPATTSLFGQPAQQQQTLQPPQQQQQQTSSLFGQPAKPAGLFGQAQPAQSGSLFGQPQAQPSQAGSLFGQPQPQQQIQSSSLFGAPQQSSSSLFARPPPQQQLTLGGHNLSVRQKTIPEQIEQVFEKWSSLSPQSHFQYYFYNYVGENEAPYFRPSEREDERKWEEALAKKPGPGHIPVLARGFKELGMRVQLQNKQLMAYNSRLHEINSSLTAMLQKHDLVLTIRAAEARKRHQVLIQRILSLATKTQVLRNRGYAMGGDEEDLKKKITDLEKGVFDPILSGRAEEIWARMVGIRERARVLKEELEKTGSTAPKEGPGLDEEVVKKVEKILTDYASQLAHLKKELGQIQKEYEDWHKDNEKKSVKKS